MKHFDQILQEHIAEYEGRHDDLIYQTPALFRLLTHLLDDPRLPSRYRPLVLAAIAYFILPVDVIPEELEGPYGYVDDIWLCALVAEKLRSELGDDVLIANWDGEAPITPLIQDILQSQDDLLGESGEQVLTYIGYEYLQKLFE
jgi:uncharacterized membrane protein YkvA (DUF1232 family)